MQYSLGNMLKGGGALNPDGLALDLAFALDRSFTTDPAAAGGALITSRRGPAAKFSRGSGATQVNAAGLIEYAPENLILRSEGMPTLWNPVDSSISPDVEVSPSGLTNADKLVENSLLASHRIEQPFTPISSTTYTASIFVKPAERNFVLLGFTGGGMATTYVSANLSAETVSTAIGTPIASSITKFANGWYRVSITLASTGVTSSFFDVRISTDGVWANRSYLGDGTSGIFLWGAQLERASTARTYYPTTTAAFYGPRFDHDPATGDCKGLLIEESRTNLIATSVPGTNWTSGTGAHTVTQNSTDVGVAPDGSLPTKVVCTTSGNYQISFTAVTGTQYTASIYARVLSGTGDIRVGGIVVGSFTASTATDEWARYSNTNTSTTTGSRFLQINMQAGETLYLWGAQVEAGAFATSYIPTTSGTAARSADVCSITDTDFSSFYNQSEGTLFASSSMFAPLVGSSRRVVTISDGTTGNRNTIGNIIPGFVEAGLTQVFLVSSGGTAQATLGVQGLTLASLNRTVGAYKVNDFAASTNGSAVVTDTGGLVAASVDRLEIGNQLSVDLLCGHIARIQYFRKRLSNAKLQTITTP
jgi:hypothetical protein